MKGWHVVALAGAGFLALRAAFATQRPPLVDTGGGGRDHLLEVNGRGWTTSAPVDHSLVFVLGDPGTHARSAAVRYGVLHRSDGEPRDGSSVYRTLVHRELSVHFVVDRAGVIWQCADPGRVQCAHASSDVNAVSWGVEIVGRQGSEFSPAQLAATLELCEVMADALAIPRTAQQGTRRLPDEEIASFRGVLGHLHVTRGGKTDPGPEIFATLADQPGWTGRR